VIAFLTDVEGRWNKLATFTDGNPHVWLEDGKLRLADDATFVFGGDAIDRGPAARRIVELLLAARRDYGDRVVLLAGNRDINKLRLVRELTGEPPARAPSGTSRGDLLRWIFTATMGAPKAFEHRAAELAAEGRPADDDAVVQSYLDDLAPGGPLRAYLGECRLGLRAGATLFVHGGVTRENVGVVPGAARAATVDGWLAALDEFYQGELAAFAAGRAPSQLIAYQAPLPGTHLNQTSVVYARPTDDLGNPHLPDVSVIEQLRASGIARLVLGHTPSGDCPSVVRDGDFELVLADNSYSRVELGSQVAITDDAITVRATTELDDGTRETLSYTSARREDSALGHRERESGRLVKAPLDGDRYLMFRGLPEHRVLQVATRADDLRPLIPARD
jgi:Calcineurin-like phosphoesterase